MTYKEFERKSNYLKRKMDLIILLEFLDLYDEYYKSKNKEVSPIHICNEVCNLLIYTESQKEEIINIINNIRNNLSIEG